MSLPDAVLDRYLTTIREFATTVIYRIDEPTGRGGFGAGGDQTGSWQGDSLVVSTRRGVTVSLSLDGDRLKRSRRQKAPGDNQETTLEPEWFDRVK